MLQHGAESSFLHYSFVLFSDVLLPSNFLQKAAPRLWASLTVSFTFGSRISFTTVHPVWQCRVSYWERSPTWVNVQMLLSWNSHFLTNSILFSFLLWVPQIMGLLLFERCLDIVVLHHSFHQNTVQIPSGMPHYQDRLEVSQVPSLFMSFEIAAWCLPQSFIIEILPLDQSIFVSSILYHGFWDQICSYLNLQLYFRELCSVIYLGTFGLEEKEADQFPCVLH